MDHVEEGAHLIHVSACMRSNHRQQEGLRYSVGCDGNYIVMTMFIDT